MNANLAYQEEIYDEMINGQIVLMSPSPMANHVYAAGNIYRILQIILKEKFAPLFLIDLTFIYPKKTVLSLI